MELDARLWDLGTELAEELLKSIALLAISRRGSGSMQKIESEDFKVYWAGTILRIDIPESTLK